MRVEQQEHRDRSQRDGAPPDIDGSDNEQVKRRAAPRAAIVYETIRREGEDELRRAPAALAWSGLAAGLSMGFSLVGEGLLRFMLPDTSWRRLISALGYSIGFLIVILGRQQLFTENTLTPILPMLSRRDGALLGRVARLWGVVLLANLLGAGLFAWAISATDVFDPALRPIFSAIGQEALGHGFGTTLLRGIFAGWLIALMVWLLPFAEAARVFVIIIITYLVGLARLSHSIAGSVDLLYLVMSGGASWADFFVGFLIPTLLGNIVGGVALVALLNHAQVTSGAAGDDA